MRHCLYSLFNSHSKLMRYKLLLPAIYRGKAEVLNNKVSKPVWVGAEIETRQSRPHALSQCTILSLPFEQRES